MSTPTTTPELRQLNFYELQNALYDAYSLKDAAPTREKGVERIKSIYAEYARRGIVKVAQPKL
jgi:hypothetical protein